MTSATLDRARPLAPDPADPPSPAGLSPGRRRLVLAAMCLALVLVIAGVSMLAVGLPAVGDDLGLDQTSLTTSSSADPSERQSGCGCQG